MATGVDPVSPEPMAHLTYGFARQILRQTLISWGSCGRSRRPGNISHLKHQFVPSELTCFGRDSVLYIPFKDQAARTPIDANIIPLAKVVAASSAYPGFFPPIILSDSDLGADEGSIPKQYFTDAGIYDNLGLYGLRKGATASPDRVLVSDAGRSFVPPKAIDFGILRTALRAIDIFMFRIRQSDLAFSTDGLPVIMISISHEARVAGASAPAIQSQLENIRTDLDKFSQLEITELVRHGYYVTVLDRGDPAPPAIPEWDISEERWVKTTAPHMSRGHCRRVREGVCACSLFSIG